MDIEKTVSKLIKNEDDIVASMGDIISYLETVNARFAHLEGHIGQLSKRPAVIVKPNSKLFFLVAIGTAGYMGYKLADRRVQARIKQAVSDARDELRAQAEQLKMNKLRVDETMPDSGTYPN